MYSFDYKTRVRYSDTDQMGIVYYGNYATFYEIGRVESLRDIGYPYKEMEEEGVMLPVLECHSKYLKSAHYDEEITIRSTLVELPGVRAVFKHEIFGESGELIHEGEVKLVFVNKDTRKPCRPPKRLIDLLTPYYL